MELFTIAEISLGLIHCIILLKMWQLEKWAERKYNERWKN